MPDTPHARHQPVDATARQEAPPAEHFHGPAGAPMHTWFTSPARTRANAAHAKELPLHLIQLILNHLDDVADLARITRTSRLFYYMTLPRLYEEVTLRAYSDIRYINGRPEGYGSGSPFAMGMNTLVSRTFADYVHVFRLIGDWREHDMEDYKQGRVPDNSMMLQIAIRAALDKMKNLRAFAWELNSKPLNTVYQALLTKPSLTSLTLRCQTQRTPRPTTLIPPLPHLTTLVVYDIDPLCYPDDISLLLLGSKRLENIKLHWNPRMRDSGEESVNLMGLFGRCLAAKVQMPLRRFALYNLYTRFFGDGFDNVSDPHVIEEVTLVNSMSTSDPMTVFLDNTWRIQSSTPIPQNLKMMRTENTDKEGAIMLQKFKGLERMYLISNRKSRTGINPNSAAATPTTPSMATPGTPTLPESHCRSIGGDYLAAIQSNHRTMRHLLLSDTWQLSDDALFRLCQACPNLEQFGFACTVPPLESLRQVIALVPKVWAMRLLVRPGSELADKLESMGSDMHEFAMSTELWRPEYKGLKYVGLGEKFIWRLGKVVFPPKEKVMSVPNGPPNSLNAKLTGPIRKLERLNKEDVKDIEIWGMDSVEFEAKFP
ncbi:hypothetical protein P153DRAFT_296792 [Dothidotthia symphoricarpi CBS 119687]|uniref:F-box domain-containing protein n=1 Tax=Dothidotthia symphoricarpi CBS 119687 TaxID=1392245 RepID=A0A6A6A5S4_9PLEO|nr:uncharacterized protein P153DRAFT_296792 [Dothidotthia symphoricarpi CBS 119687]KAF2126896.1 hypothetical protein P153DRAFT_296792 [Dothidotthia symphoricarpi CBS 119687]